jgi:hypothetical protein
LYPWVTDWDRLTSSLAATAVNVSRLYNDGRAPAWAAAERLMRDGIPWATRWIVTEASECKSAQDGRAALKRFQGAGHTVDAAYKNEIRRLCRLHVLVRPGGAGNTNFAYHPWRYRLSSPDWRELLDHKKRILI